jgi:hypothetical protein
MEATLDQEITLGATVCERLKGIYFKEIAWPECYRILSGKFSILKSIARKFYVDKNNIEVLNELIKYKDQDIIDAFEQGGSTWNIMA